MFFCPSNETSILWIEKKNISKEGKVSLWQKQETSSGDAGSIFYWKGFIRYEFISEWQSVSKKPLRLHILRRIHGVYSLWSIRDTIRRKHPEKGTESKQLEFAARPWPSTSVPVNYLAKNSVTSHSNPPTCPTSCLPMASCYRSWKCTFWGCQTKFDNIVQINVTKSVQKCFNSWRYVEVSVITEGNYFAGKFVYTLDAWSLI